MNVQSVAIIGAGASGLAAAKYLLAEKKFSKIDIYEQRTATGGLWNASPSSPSSSSSSSSSSHVPIIPRTTPTTQHEQPGTGHDDTQFVSPVYDLLETNIPHTLMNFSDLPFPPNTPLFPAHAAVLAYLARYGRDVEHLVAFGVQVRRVSKVLPRPNTGSATNDRRHDKEGVEAAAEAWMVESRDLVSGIDRPPQMYDAVVVASGHYADPYVPDIPGLVEFEAAHPGFILHSKLYRRPEQFAGKKVLIVGNSFSGMDIGNQIATTAQLPVLISEKISPTPPSSSATTWSHHVGQLTELLPATRAARFSTNTVHDAIDFIIFCTGYHYSFPFFSGPSGIPRRLVAQNGRHVDRLWEHTLHADEPTLAFLAIPKRIIPFPIAESQAAVVARIWAGRLPAPSAAEMHAWVERCAAECAAAPETRHVLTYPQDRDYINRLHALSSRARRGAAALELENDGAGKRPPYWDEEANWTRFHVLDIRAAYRALGERRWDCTSAKQLGFDYRAEKKARRREEEEQ